MPKAPRQEVSTAPFAFVRQFTAPPFSMGLEDAKLRGQLLLAALKKAGEKQKKASAARKAAKKAVPAKSGAAKKTKLKSAATKKRAKPGKSPRLGK